MLSTAAYLPILPDQRQSDRRDLESPLSTPAAPRQTDREEVAILLKRGKELIASGDIAAARLALQRAGDANDVEATLALAATYDPHVLRCMSSEHFGQLALAI